MRGKYIKRATFVLAGVLLLLLIWGAVIEPRLVDFREETAVIPHLPKSWEGKRVALIADMQIGMWFGNESTDAKIVKRIIEERPAVVLIAGDFVYHPMDDDDADEVEKEDARDFMNEISKAVRLLHPLTEAGIPVYAVLGNHDYGMGYPDSVKNARLANAVAQALTAAGIRVLDNEALALESTNQNSASGNSGQADAKLYLAGIGSVYANNAKTKDALSQIPENAPRLIFMHNPDSFSEFPAGSAPLAVAGHTHGGQIRLPFTEDWSWMALASKEKVHADGWIDNFGPAGNRLYVNRGIGFSSFPIRINCRPELTLFTLRGGNDGR